MSRYGQHRPSDAPATVTVFRSERWPAAVDVPRPVALVRQRETINRAARST